MAAAGDAGDDWSLTPATLVRVAALASLPEGAGVIYPDAEAALEADTELSLGINCCGVCAVAEEAMEAGALYTRSHFRST
jgi:hypothetical protein